MPNYKSSSTGNITRFSKRFLSSTVICNAKFEGTIAIQKQEFYLDNITTDTLHVRALISDQLAS